MHMKVFLCLVGLQTNGHLHDQRLGGIIMWVPGACITLLAMTICIFCMG